MINYDEESWSPHYFPRLQTEEGRNRLREWARKKSLDMLARTEVGKKMAKLTRGKRM